MSNNDNKIQTLLSAINEKKKTLGPAPKMFLDSNGKLPSGLNINTLNSVDACVLAASELMLQRNAGQQACEFLGVEVSSSETLKSLDTYLADLKRKVSVINWKAEEAKLQKMEKQLKDLRSEDAKTKDALDDIEALLK